MNIFAIVISGSISVKDYQKLASHVIRVANDNDTVIFLDHKVYYDGAMSAKDFKIKSNMGGSPVIYPGNGGSDGILELDKNYLQHYPDCTKIFYLTDNKYDLNQKTKNTEWICLEDGAL